MFYLVYKVCFSGSRTVQVFNSIKKGTSFEVAKFWKFKKLEKHSSSVHVQVFLCLQWVQKQIVWFFWRLCTAVWLGYESCTNSKTQHKYVHQSVLNQGPCTECGRLWRACTNPCRWFGVRARIFYAHYNPCTFFSCSLPIRALEKIGCGRPRILVGQYVSVHEITTSVHVRTDSVWDFVH